MLGMGVWAHRALLYAIAPLSHIDASKVSKGVVEEGLMDNSVSGFTFHISGMSD